MPRAVGDDNEGGGEARRGTRSVMSGLHRMRSAGTTAYNGSDSLPSTTITFPPAWKRATAGRTLASSFHGARDIEPEPEPEPEPDRGLPVVG